MQQVSLHFKCGHSIHQLFSDDSKSPEVYLNDPCGLTCPVDGQSWPIWNDVIAWEVRYRGQSAVEAFYSDIIRANKRRAKKAA